MSTNALFPIAARVLTGTLIGGAAVFAGTAAATVPSHSVESMTVVNAASSHPYSPSTCRDGVAWGESANGYRVCITRAGGPAADPVAADHAAGPADTPSDEPADGPADAPADEPSDEPDVEAAAVEATDDQPTTRNDGKVDVVFEVTGSGTADAVTIDDGPVKGFSDVPMPFRKTSRVPADIDLLQVHVSGSHDNNTACRIILDGKVVVSSPNGDCVYTR